MDCWKIPEQNFRLLILGGARSGKSRYGEQIVRSCPAPWIYVATAEARDDEMKQKIEIHRNRRSRQWTTIEEPVDLSGVLESRLETRQTLLIDCLTLWVSNLIISGDEITPVLDRFCHAIRSYRGCLIMVSNEVGLGIVPDTKLGRQFREIAGALNQQIAEIVDSVHFIVSGLPIILKDNFERQ